jgi:hypothetical protein
MGWNIICRGFFKHQQWWVLHFHLKILLDLTVLLKQKFHWYLHLQSVNIYIIDEFMDKKNPFKKLLLIIYYLKYIDRFTNR